MSTATGRPDSMGYSERQIVANHPSVNACYQRTDHQRGGRGHPLTHPLCHPSRGIGQYGFFGEAQQHSPNVKV